MVKNTKNLNILRTEHNFSKMTHYERLLFCTQGNLSIASSESVLLPIADFQFLSMDQNCGMKSSIKKKKD